MSISIFSFDEVPNVLIFDRIDSTSKELSRMVGNGFAEQGDIILAGVQTDGYGRDGRKWESQSGNLFASFLLKPKIPIEQLTFVSFLLAKNILEVLQEIIKDKANVSYKWPNDIMLNDKKIGGVLLQTYLAQGSNICDTMICGLGLNLKHHPEFIQSTDIFHEIQLILDRNAILFSILQRFDIEYQKSYGLDRMDEIIAFLKSNTNLLGKEITVHDGDAKKSGICSDIDRKGNLVLDYNNSMERILSADIIDIVA
jgi:BirA family transcriptional regulator, biotin operon repressor / biotin---[acetyl-CoA-carboxylase] ligase